MHVQEDDAAKAERARIDELAVAHAPDFVGMTASDAEAHAKLLGLTVRIVGSGWYTSDYRIGRVTAHLVDGLIATAAPG